MAQCMAQIFCTKPNVQPIQNKKKVPSHSSYETANEGGEKQPSRNNKTYRKKFKFLNFSIYQLKNTWLICTPNLCVEQTVYYFSINTVVNRLILVSFVTNVKNTMCNANQAPGSEVLKKNNGLKRFFFSTDHFTLKIYIR